MAFRTGTERNGFFVTDAVSGEALVVGERNHERIPSVTDDAPDPLNTCRDERIDEQISDRGHDRTVRNTHSATPVAVPNTRCALTSFHNVAASYSQTGS